MIDELMKVVFVIAFLAIATLSCQGQYFQFSQYNFTSMRINPAMVGMSDYAELSLDYRNQSTDGGFHLTSNFLNATYPLISRYGKRWAGIGVSMMDDRSGQAGIFNTQEAALSYAAIVQLDRTQTLSLGVKGLYQTSKINLDGFYTGSQYIPDRGFDESLSRGENFGSLKRDFFTFSAGLYWQNTDRNGNRIAYGGLSFFDFNKPGDSFYGKESDLSSTLVANIGARVYQQGNLSIMPEMLITNSASLMSVNAGLVTSYILNQQRNRPAERIDLISKYAFGRSAILGIQLHRENFSAGFSYDFPFIKRNVANTGTYEVGIELKSPVQPRGRGRTSRNKNPKLAGFDKRGRRIDKNKDSATETAATDTMASVSIEEAKADTLESKPAMTMSERLKQKRDSIETLSQAGEISHEPLVLERATLHFNFDFNSSTLGNEAKRYLDEVADALMDNEELDIKLVGHTDNVGSERFNLRLSMRRAEMIMEYLVDKGVDVRRIIMEGKGMSEPLNDNSTDEDRAVNRRVEMTILYDNLTKSPSFSNESQ